MKGFLALLTLGLCINSFALASECEIVDKNDVLLGVVRSNGHVGLKQQNGAYKFGGFVDFRGQVFAGPTIVSRGSRVECWVNSHGRVDSGSVFDHGYNFIGTISETGEINDRQGAIQGRYRNCDNFPLNLRLRIVGGASLIALLHKSGDVVDDSWRAYDGSLCYWQ